MRRIAYVAAALTVALLLPTTLLGQATPPKPRIGITATVEGVKVSNGDRVRFYLLWNREISARPIGHGYASCQLGPADVFVCTSIYALPYGKIVTVGEVHSFANYTSVITGGSRSKRAVREGKPGYPRIAGTATATRLGPGTYALTLVLEP